VNPERRTLLKTLLSSVAVAGLPGPVQAAIRPAHWDRTLILIELNGGNDGLNTVIPYRDPEYRRLRPTLAIDGDQVLKLDEQLGLHPSLARLMPAWRDKQLAISLGVGYPDPDFSHFRSIDIWDTASDSQDYLERGWVAEIFRTDRPPGSAAAEGVILGRNSAGPLYGPEMRTISLKQPGKLRMTGAELRSDGQLSMPPALAHILKTERALGDVSRALLSRRAETLDPGVDFPATDFGRQLKAVAQLIISGARIPVFKTSLSGFDTHSNQLNRHARLLLQFAEAVAAFSASMKRHGLWGNTLLMTYGEFGRRPRENASRGTDHGSAAPQFLIGGGVRGDLYGTQPPLDRLQGENLTYRLHFRRMYATVIREWWGLQQNFIHELPLDCIV